MYKSTYLIIEVPKLLGTNFHTLLLCQVHKSFVLVVRSVGMHQCHKFFPFNHFCGHIIYQLLFPDWGFFKLDGKSKTSKGVEFKTAINSNKDTGKVAGNLETKYKWSEYGKYL